MPHPGTDDNLTPAPPATADDALAQSLESLLALGLPPDPKQAARIRPLAHELLLELSPQDAAERMLAVQMIASFSRSMFLARNANHQKHAKWFSLYSRECDRSMAMFRRQMQTFTDLRRPRRSSFTAIRQANIAGQQLVVNQPPPLQPPAPHGQPFQETQAALPPQQNHPRRPARKRPEKPPLAT